MPENEKINPEDHLGLLHKVASERMLSCPSAEFDDLISWGYIGLVKAARRFDPALGSFSTYAWHTIRGEIQSEYSKFMHGVTPRGARPSFVSLETLPDLTAPEKKSFQLSESAEHHLASLRATEREVLTMYYIQGLTGPEIAARRGCSKTRIYDIIARAIAYLRRIEEIRPDGKIPA